MRSFWGISLVLILSFSARASIPLTGLNIVGSWKFVSFLYQGQMHPPLESNLNLIFQFSANGQESLSWTRTGEPGFCQAGATYQIIHNQLHTKITSINPQNNYDCSSDPDMQLGKESITPVELRSGQLFLNIGLSGEDLFYIFEPITQSQTLSTERNL